MRIWASMVRTEAYQTAAGSGGALWLPNTMQDPRHAPLDVCQRLPDPTIMKNYNGE